MGGRGVREREGGGGWGGGGGEEREREEEGGREGERRDGELFFNHIRLRNNSARPP